MLFGKIFLTMVSRYDISYLAGVCFAIFKAQGKDKEQSEKHQACEKCQQWICDIKMNFAKDEGPSGVSGQAAQPVPLASQKLSMAVCGQKLDG